MGNTAGPAVQAGGKHADIGQGSAIRFLLVTGCRRNFATVAGTYQTTVTL
jgi:hypothetical protein